MIERLRRLRAVPRTTHTADEEEPTTPVFTGLRLFSADLLLSAGANATLHYLRSGRRSRGSGATGPVDVMAGGSGLGWQASAAAWVPMLLGAAACTAQVRHALEPTDRRHTAVTLLNGAVVGFGVAGVVQGIAETARGARSFSIAPLLFGYTGLLGFLLDHQEGSIATDTSKLEHRARIVDRLVPRRRTRVQKVVVHV